MKFIGERFLQLEVKREEITGEATLGNIQSNITPLNVKEGQGVVEKGYTSLIFEYEYKTVYNLEKPKDKELARIYIKGDVIFLFEDKKAKQILKEWSKDKKLPDDAIERVLQAIVNKAQIESVILAKELNLPSPVQLPLVKKKE